MSKLYNISFYRPVWQPTPQFPQVVDSALGAHGEWIRASTNIWFLWSNSTPQQLNATLQAIAQPTDQFIITSVAPVAAQGFAPQWIWNWINDKMNRQFRGDS